MRIPPGSGIRPVTSIEKPAYPAPLEFFLGQGVWLRKSHRLEYVETMKIHSRADTLAVGDRGFHSVPVANP